MQTRIHLDRPFWLTVAIFARTGHFWPFPTIPTLPPSARGRSRICLHRAYERYPGRMCADVVFRLRDVPLPLERLSRCGANAGEKVFPLLTYVQLAVVWGPAPRSVVLIPWSGRSPRTGLTTVSPEVTRMLHRCGMVPVPVSAGPPFSILDRPRVGAVILRDREQPAVFPDGPDTQPVGPPSWFAPAGLMAFFKTGPMAYKA